MKIFTAKHEVVIDMHERGYCEDFQLAGNDLYWLQGKQILRTGDFFITEYHRFFGDNGKNSCIAIFAVVVIHNSIKGILIKHCHSNLVGIAPAIKKK